MTDPTDDDLDLLVSEVADEFRDRRSRGEDPDPEEYSARHPHAAEVLRRVLATLRLVGPAAPPAPPPEPPPRGVVGDFRIVREVGRGGMGVVYEAEQVSLGRRVALKVLPFAGALDARHLQRFRNEARAAASLHHEHIVPVYAVGSDRGVHYYAMQFIDGRPLTEVIADAYRPVADAPPAAPTVPAAAAATAPGRRPPDFHRTAARVAAEAADALEHAHARGVVHRDVKPGNILIDGSGKAWVTDFGLARVGADAGLTVTGDVLGTLRYMAPEQALARHDLVDHRADVYALGATLYELVTGAPAVPGDDRARVLRRLAEDDPVPPRRLDPSVPRDLETVALKCLEKDPADRYPTARDLADDLRRFLTDRPVLARRPMAGQRVGRWARRHLAALTAAAVGLLVAVAALSATTAQLWRAQSAKEAALEDRRRAADRAEEQRRRAEENFRRSIQGVSRLVLRLNDPDLGPRDQRVAAQRAVCDEAARLYLSFPQDRATDPAARWELGVGLVHLGILYGTFGDRDKSLAILAQAVDVLDRLADDEPEREDYRLEAASARVPLAETLLEAGRGPEAEAVFRRSGDLFRQAWEAHQTVRVAKSYAYFLASCKFEPLRDPGTAIWVAEWALDRAPDDAGLWHTLGTARYRAGEYREAIAAIERVDLLHPAGAPNVLYIRAMAHWQLGERQQAVQWYEQEVERARTHLQGNMVLQAEAGALLGIDRD